MAKKRDGEWGERFVGKLSTNTTIPHLKDLDEELWQRKTQTKPGQTLGSSGSMSERGKLDADP